MRTANQINAEMLSLWKETFPYSDMAYSPLLHPAPKPEQVVFVGMNPSFSAKGWKNIQRQANVPDLNPESFFAWPCPADFDISISHKLDEVSRQQYAFFKPHRELSQKLKKNWLHLDLFAIRETSQKTVRPLILESGADLKLTPFGQKQVELFNDLLHLASPTAVIIVNALASRIYLKERNPKFDPMRGCYIDSNGDGHKFPVFPSGMLTGARALDRFSKERLFWTVEHVLTHASS